MLNVKIVSTSVRTAGWWRTHARPSPISCRSERLATRSRPEPGRRIPATISAATATSTACTANGTAGPNTNRAAPIGGPASWLTVMKAPRIRWFAAPRSSRATSIGVSVADALSAKTSRLATTNSANRTLAMLAVPVDTLTVSVNSTAARTVSTATTRWRRSSRSDSTPAHMPNSSGGSHCTAAAAAISAGLPVSEATSSGPAASAMPSPVLLSQVPASSRRKPAPNRSGDTASINRPRTSSGA